MVVHLNLLHHVEFLINIVVAKLVIVQTLVVNIVGLTVITSRDSTQRTNSDVLVQEIFGHEIIHEVLLCDVTSIFIIFFHDNLLELLANCLAYLFEQEIHRFGVFVDRDVFIELLVNFLNDFGAPVVNLVVYKVHFLVELVSLFFFFRENFNFCIKLIDFLVIESVVGAIVPVAGFFGGAFILLVFHLELVESLSLLLVIKSQFINFSFIVGNLHEQMGISLLTSHEILYDFVNVRETCSCSNVLESLFNLRMIFHFIFHFSSQEFSEKTMNKKLILHFNFILILILVSCHFCNFLLMSNSCNSSLKSFRFIRQRFIQSANSFSSFHLILIDLHNDLFKLHFGLNPVLLSFSLVFGLFDNQIIFLLERIFELLRFQL